MCYILIAILKLYLAIDYTDQMASIDRMRREDKMRAMFGRLLCRLGFHDWDDWQEGRALKSRECRREGCKTGIDLKCKD